MENVMEEKVEEQENAATEQQAEKTPEIDITTLREEKHFTQEDVNHILAENKRHLRTENAELKERLARLEGLAGKEEKPDKEVKPQPRDFDDYDSYVEALTDWKVGEKVRTFEEGMAKKEQEGLRVREREAFFSRVEKVRDKYPDFNSVAMNPDLPITPTMADAIRESEFGADIAYWLGKNPREAERIVTLSSVIAQAREIGKIEAMFQSNTTTKRISSAPPPPSTVGEGRAAANLLTSDPASDSLSTAEWMKRERARKKGG